MVESVAMRHAISFESVSLVIALASLLASVAATLIAKSSLSQAKQVADRDERDWRQRKWADMYLKADETYDGLDRFRVLSDSWDTEERGREWNDLMRLIRGAHAMAVVFPENPAVDAFLSSVITSKAANGYHFKTGQRKRPSRTENVLPCRLLWWQVGFGAPAPRTALEHMSVVQ